MVGVETKDRLGWKTIVSVCYFLLTIMFALTMVLFFFGGTMLGIFLASLVVIVGVAGYSSFRAFQAGKKLRQVANPSVAQVVSIVAVLGTAVLAWVSYAENSVFFTAILVGATGGLVHEIAQSNGKFILPQADTKDEVYLGGLFGLVAGGVSGIILVQGMAETIVSTRLIGEAFLAGLGLKGFADAVAAKRPDKKEKSKTNPSARS